MIKITYELTYYFTEKLQFGNFKGENNQLQAGDLIHNLKSSQYIFVLVSLKNVLAQISKQKLCEYLKK
jgi:hypothetical protein